MSLGWGHGDIYKMISDLRLIMPSDQITMEMMLDNNFSSIISERVKWLGEQTR